MAGDSLASESPRPGGEAVGNADYWAQIQAVGMSGVRGPRICMLSLASLVILKNSKVEEETPSD